MKLIVYNGSPRGLKSNTRVLADQFISGLAAAGVTDVDVIYLAKKSDRIRGAIKFAEATHVILAFPLYTDAMPGIVKEFIEMLEPNKDRNGNPAMGYIVHSGFPEPAHSRFVERYLQKLTVRMTASYIGTAVKGGTEGVRLMPSWMTGKTRSRFFALGRKLPASGKFDTQILKKLAPREHFSRRRSGVFRLMKKLNLTNMYWNSMLKQNGAWDQRYDAPYGSPAR